ncbi:hypothetical protein M501DRAFT_1010816 [Patellaria atrata CBS 101060]|uniref:Rad21/Rec8-like protein N-terminal domain-containing protein n=1 Tax=Patellaria atrata CBS 101060 TaxID=1346257 RepID=A0A9P4SBX1_9PEZI|nr:hypothetical protein M501DRAFT_1010816 [Patellaria atrata CBS 101060]
MFYSHEVLTSRKYGVATVWLVATLGPKSSLKKVNRKAILDVNVPKACETILTPEAPMALRLQSNLLVGVSRVYDQQCGYVLSDAQTTQNNIRQMLRVVSAEETDVETGRARPDQLVLEDDPAFLPDLLMDFDLSGIDVSSTSNSSVQSPHTPRTPEDAMIRGLIIPSTDTAAGADIGGFIISGDDHHLTSASKPLGGSVLSAREEDDGLLPEADFEFDAEGNLLEFTTPLAGPRQSSVGTARPVPGSDGTSSRVRREHEEGQMAGLDQLGERMDFDLPLEDDCIPLPEGEAFPTIHRSPPREEQKPPSAAPGEELEATNTAEAPMRRRPRAPRIIPLDTNQELRSREIARWNTTYAQTMAEGIQHKLHHRLAMQAKKNADFWVWGAGIGGIGRGLGAGMVAGPLRGFCGDALFEAITGVSRAPVVGRKREHDDTEPGTEDAERRVRPRSDGQHSDEIGRAGVEDMDEGFAPEMEDLDPEHPRAALSTLSSNPASSMPWNLSATRNSSLRATLPPGAATSTLGRPSSRSRYVSASPLLRHSRGDLTYLGSDLDDDDIGGPLFSDGPQGERGERHDPTTQDFEAFGPAAYVDTQTAGETQWLRSALDAEGMNFLSFVEARLEERGAGIQTEGARDGEVGFAELLPPAVNSNVVAAQGLLHVLGLATKGLLGVRQEGVGEIWVSVVGV